MSGEGGNTIGGDVTIDAATDMRVFDTLPRAIKEIYWNAPYDFAGQAVRMAVLHIGDVRKARAALAYDVAYVARRECQRLWDKDVGVGHPCIARFARIAEARFMKGART